jgi:type II secretory pathway pseudopilin PulG
MKNFTFQPFVTKRNLIYLAIILSILLVSIFGFFRIRTYLDRRSVVLEIINTNIDVYNSSTEKSRTLLIDIKNQLDFSGSDQDQTNKKLNQLQDQLPKIDSLVNEIDGDTKKIKKGDNDLANLHTVYNEGLATKQATLKLLSRFIKYEVCIIQNSSKQSTNVDQFSKNINTFATSDAKITVEEKRNLMSQANTGIQENSKLTGEIQSCFADSYSRFNSPEMKTAIEKDVVLYNKYTEATSLIVDGLSTTDSVKLQNGTAQLLQLKDQNPTLFTSEPFKKALNDPKKLIQDQALILEKQENKIKDQLASIKDKYQID